jgi:hypothetical protein
MQTPKPRRLASGSWFIQLRLGGESIPVTARSAVECTRAAELIKAEHRTGKRATGVQDITLRGAVDRYIDSRSNTISPSTVRGYDIIKRNRFSAVMDKRIRDISDWQQVCNAESLYIDVVRVGGRRGDGRDAEKRGL